MILVTLIIGVLIASFLVSAMRLYHIGRIEFFTSIQHGFSATVAGGSGVVLAEASAVLFTVSLSALGRSKFLRAVFILLAALSTVWAFAGNYFAALYGHEATLFSWLDAMLPPIFTIGASIALEQIMFAQMEQYHQDNERFRSALSVYEKQTANPADHDRFMPLYANALKDKVYEVNKRRSWQGQKVVEIMNMLTHQEWSVLVQREMNADIWYKPTEITARAQEVAPAMGFLAAAPMPLNRHQQD
jgi:hypothetical protein